MTFIAITGRPGVGKTTVFFSVVNKLRECGIKLCGFYCPEVREHGRRVGFKIIDIVSGSEGWLALSIDKAKDLGIPTTGRKRVGRYIVVEEDAASVGMKALERCHEAILLAIDEIGPMELSVEKLRLSIIDALSKAPNAFLVIHRNLRDRDVLKILSARGAKTYVVTEVNRNELPRIILDQFSRLCVDMSQK